MDKKFVPLFLDQKEVFESLSNAEAGILVKAVLDYANGGELNLPKKLLPVFVTIRQGIDRSFENLKKKSEIYSKNAKQRWNQPQNNAIAYNGMQNNAIAYNTNTNTNTNTKKNNTVFDTNMDTSIDTSIDTPRNTKQETNGEQNLPWEILDELERGQNDNT